MSYVDILICLTLVRGVFVARSDMAHWPILGSLASACHAIFVDRSCVHQRLQTLFQIKRKLQAGQSVVIFPEGTTRDQHYPDAKDWHGGVFWAPRRAERPVFAIGISYENHASVKWVDDDELIPSLWQLLLQPRSIARVNMRIVTTKELTIRDEAAFALGVVCSLIESCQPRIDSQLFRGSSGPAHS